MRYHNITKDDMLNGEGLRVVLWVAGCSHGCPECHNPVTWDIQGGIPFDEAALEEIRAELEKEYVSGLTLSGGDPLHPANRADIRALAANHAPPTRHERNRTGTKRHRRRPELRLQFRLRLHLGFQEAFRQHARRRRQTPP